MVKYYYKNARGGALQELDKPQPGTWVHAEAPTETEVADLVKRFNLDLGIVSDALDEDEQPREGKFFKACRHASVSSGNSVV